MGIRHEILQFATDYGIPDYMMCNCMCLTEEEYKAFKRGELKLSVFSLIMFISSTEYVPPSA